MSVEKRKRSPNWLPSEKSLLLGLVEKHYRVIKNRKTDGVTMKQKLAEWQILSHEYNSQTTHCSRTAENLKKEWEYMKKKAKKEESYRRMHRIQTGGGPTIPKKEDPLDSKIISLIKTGTVEPELCNKDLETELNEIQKSGIDSNEVLMQKSVAEKELLHSNEVHNLDLQIKREQLKQEKLKTRILLLDLRLKKKQLNNKQ